MSTPTRRDRPAAVRRRHRPRCRRRTQLERLVQLAQDWVLMSQQPADDVVVNACPISCKCYCHTPELNIIQKRARRRLIIEAQAAAYRRKL